MAGRLRWITPLADADVSVGASIELTIPDGTTIDMSGQQKSPSTILVVTEKGRNNIDDSGQVLNLAKDNEVDLLNAGVNNDAQIYVAQRYGVPDNARTAGTRGG